MNIKDQLIKNWLRWLTYFVFQWLKPFLQMSIPTCRENDAKVWAKRCQRNWSSEWSSRLLLHMEKTRGITDKRLGRLCSKHSQQRSVTMGTTVVRKERRSSVDRTRPCGRSGPGGSFLRVSFPAWGTRGWWSAAAPNTPACGEPWRTETLHRLWVNLRACVCVFVCKQIRW